MASRAMRTRDPGTGRSACSPPRAWSRCAPCCRSFYVGEGVRPEDVKGKFESGILQISLPKAEQKKLPAQTMIAIE